MINHNLCDIGLLMNQMILPVLYSWSWYPTTHPTYESSTDRPEILQTPKIQFPRVNLLHQAGRQASNLSLISAGVRGDRGEVTLRILMRTSFYFVKHFSTKKSLLFKCRYKPLKTHTLLWCNDTFFWHLTKQLGLITVSVNKQHTENSCQTGVNEKLYRPDIGI